MAIGATKWRAVRGREAEAAQGRAGRCLVAYLTSSSSFLVDLEDARPVYRPIVYRGTRALVVPENRYPVSYIEAPTLDVPYKTPIPSQSVKPLN